MPSLLIYIYLHCVRRLSWSATYMATLMHNLSRINFQMQTNTVSSFLLSMHVAIQCKYQFFRSLRISLRIIRLSCSYAPPEAPYLHYWASCSMLLLYVYRSLKAQIGNFLVDFIYINQLGCLARSIVRQVNNAITWNRLLWPVSWKGAKQLPIFLLLSFLFFFCLPVFSHSLASLRQHLAVAEPFHTT